MHPPPYTLHPAPCTRRVLDGGRLNHISTEPVKFTGDNFINIDHRLFLQDISRPRDAHLQRQRLTKPVYCFQRQMREKKDEDGFSSVVDSTRLVFNLFITRRF